MNKYERNEISGDEKLFPFGCYPRNVIENRSERPETFLD
jgi:hypothetical protein